MKRFYKRALSYVLCVALLAGVLSASVVMAANESLDNFAGRNVFRENMFSDVAEKAWYAGRFGLVEQKVTSVPDGVRYVRITMNPIAWPWYGRIYNVDLRIS